MSAYDSTILAEASLTHYYPLNDAVGSTSAADAKGSLALTANGVTFGGRGLVPDGETTAVFSGTPTSYLTLPGNLLPASGPFTIEAIVYPTGTASTEGDDLIWFSADNASGLDIFFTSATSNTERTTPAAQGYPFFPAVVLDVAGQPGDASGDSTGFAVWPGGPVLIHVTYDGTNYKVATNGVFSNYAASGARPSTSGGQLGGYAATPGDGLAGYISKFAIYNSVLTAAQIAAHWNAAQLVASVPRPGVTVSNLSTVTPNSTDLVAIEHGAAGGPYALSKATIASLVTAGGGGGGGGGSSSSPQVAQTATTLANGPFTLGFNSPTTAGNLLILLAYSPNGLSAISGWTTQVLEGTLFIATRTATGNSQDEATLPSVNAIDVTMFEIADTVSGFFGAAVKETTGGYQCILPSITSVRNCLIFMIAGCQASITPTPDFPYVLNPSNFGQYVLLGYTPSNYAGLKTFSTIFYNGGGSPSYGAVIGVA